MKYKRIAIPILTVSFLVSIVTLASAIEPKRPIVTYTFDSKKEAKIQELKGLSIEEAFERLKRIDFSANEDLLHKAIFTVFAHRKTEAIALALSNLNLPKIKIVDGKRLSRHADFYLAKKILQIFPHESVDSLLELYENSDAVTKGNIIRAAGKMAGGPAIRKLLIGALDDKTFCEEKYPEILGEPLRICDLTYNQLVLRYKIKNVLRTIGTAHRIEIRDYHIDILKRRL